MEILEYTSIDELNRIYDMIGELPDYIADSLEEFLSGYVTLEELVEHKDEVIFIQTVTIWQMLLIILLMVRNVSL